MKLKNLQVRTEYIVGLGDLEVPENIGKQLKEIFEEGSTIDGSDEKYSEAIDWLNVNIKDTDAFELNYEIEELN